MPMPSSNAEDEERMFKFYKKCARCTSNHHPDNVLDNIFIRSQVREEFNAERNICKKRKSGESMITKSGRKLPPKTETVIPLNLVEKYPRLWQAHLERIADFLPVKGLWVELKTGIKFNDLNQINLPISHFRNMTIKKELIRVKNVWSEVM